MADLQVRGGKIVYLDDNGDSVYELPEEGITLDAVLAAGDSSNRNAIVNTVTANDVTADTVTSTGNIVGNYVVKRIHLKTTASQSYTEGNTYNLPLNTQTHIDTDIYTHSTSSNNHLITINESGLYNIIGNFVFDNGTESARNTFRVSVVLNSSRINSTSSYDYDRGSIYGRYSNNKINTVLDLDADDEISIQIFAQNVDGSPTLESDEIELIIWRIGVGT